jgi:hypothetical protein
MQSYYYDRIVASESLCLPPRSEVVTLYAYDKVIPSGKQFAPGISIVEPSDRVTKSE